MIERIGNPGDAWDDTASIEHVKKLTALFGLKNISYEDRDTDRGFMAELPSGNLLKLNVVMGSATLRPPKEVEDQTHYPLKLTFNVWPSTQVEDLKDLISEHEAKLAELVKEHTSEETKAFREERAAYLAKVEKQAHELIRRVMQSETFLEHGGDLIPDHSNPILSFTYHIEDEDEIQLLRRILRPEMERYVKDLDAFKQFFVLAPIAVDGLNTQHLWVSFDTTEDLTLAHPRSFLAASHEALRKRLATYAHRLNDAPRQVEEAVTDKMLKRYSAHMRSFIEGDEDMVQSTGLERRADGSYTFTVHLKTTDADEGALFAKLLQRRVQAKIPRATVIPFGRARPKMGIGVTVIIPDHRMLESRTYSTDWKTHAFSSMYSYLRDLKAEEGAAYLRAFPHQHLFVLGLEKGTDEDELKLLQHMITKQAATRLGTIAHQVQRTSWDNGPALSVFFSDYGGIERDIKAGVMSVVTEARNGDTKSINYFKAVERIREKLVETALELGNSPILQFNPAMGNVDDVQLSVDGGMSTHDEELIFFRLIAQQAKRLAANEPLVVLDHVDPPLVTGPASSLTGFIVFKAAETPDRSSTTFVDWHLARKMALSEGLGPAEPAFKTPEEIALTKQRMIAFETAIRREISWINVAMRSIDPPAGMFEFDRGFHLESKGIMFELMCRHPEQQEHALWLRLAKAALEKPKDEGVVVTIEHSHGNEEQWVADWSKWPEVDTPDWVHHICITINDEDLHEACSWITTVFRNDFVRRELDPRWREESFDDHARDLTLV